MSASLTDSFYHKDLPPAALLPLCRSTQDRHCIGFVKFKSRSQPWLLPLLILGRRGHSAKVNVCTQTKPPKLAFKNLDLLCQLLQAPDSSLLWVAAGDKAPRTQTNVADAREESRAWLRRLGPARSWTSLCVYKFLFDNSVLKMGFIKGQL